MCLKAAATPFGVALAELMKIKRELSPSKAVLVVFPDLTQHWALSHAVAPFHPHSNFYGS